MPPVNGVTLISRTGAVVGSLTGRAIEIKTRDFSVITDVRRRSNPSACKSRGAYKRLMDGKCTLRVVAHYDTKQV